MLKGKQIGWLEKKKPEPGVMSYPLAVNIASKKQYEIDFESLADVPTLNVQQEVTALLDEHSGKRVFLTPFENRLIAALSYAVTQGRNIDEDVQEAEQSIEKWQQSKEPVERVISIKELSKFVLQRSPKASDRKKVRDTIIEISHKRQAQVYVTNGKQGDGKTHLILAPLLNVIEEDITSEEDNMTIRFGRLFFHQVSTRYIELPVKLFQITARKGSGAESDVFWQLFLHLSSQYPLKHTAHKTAAARVRKKNKSEGSTATEAEITSQIQTAKEASLYIRVLGTTLREKTTTDYGKDRRSRRFIEDVENASSALVELGLVEKYKQGKSEGVVCWDYWLNPNYNRISE